MLDKDSKRLQGLQSQVHTKLNTSAPQHGSMLEPVHPGWGEPTFSEILPVVFNAVIIKNWMTET